MPKKEDDNPLEEMQKQLRDLMNNKNVQVAFAPFMQSMKDQAKDADDGGKGGGDHPRNHKRRISPGMRNWIPFGVLIVGPKRSGITWTDL